MTIIQLILQNFFAFILIISGIVFIHEFGHFIVARFCKVKVDEFAIGFGKELFGFNDKYGTRWKFCLLPFGGYVKMYGDRNASSMSDAEAISKMSDEDKKRAFIGKNVYQRMAIVIAGPVANFILAIVIFTFLFKANGVNKILPVIDEVFPESAGFEAGLRAGDRVLEINSKKITDFSQIKEFTLSGKKTLNFLILRNEKTINLQVTPKIQSSVDFFGDEIETPIIGITASEILSEEVNLWQSFILANKETYNNSVLIINALFELITGKRNLKELGGPIKIAKYSGKTFEIGIVAVFWFVAMISINLGVMNLLPVPVLDGGHLFYYIFEVILGKPLPKKVQEVGFRIGFSLIMTLMIFATFNDILQIFN